MPLIFNGHRGQLLNNAQYTPYHTGDDGDVESGLTRPTYIVMTAGSQSGTTNVDTPHYANSTISFSHGARQVETATVVATISQAGDATFTVTAANSVNLAAGKAIAVTVALNDTAILVAGKARTVLGADADVSAFFTVGGTGATVVLTAKTAAANDTTMNCASIDGTCIGITAAANSANTVGGDVTTHCVYDTASDTNQTGTTTSGNKIISGLTSTAALMVGMSIGGNGVGSSSVIATIDSSTQVTGTVNSTVTNTVNITFTSTVLFTSVITADTIIFVGTTSNSGALTVATGGNASRIIVTESVTDEAAGAIMTLYKRSAPSNNVVYDETSKLYYRRYTTKTEKIGDASGGKLVWYSAPLCYTLHVPDANLSIDAATKVLTIAGGAGEIGKFKTGTLLEFSGFTIPNNNRAGGYRCDSVATSGSDLVIGLWTGYGVDKVLTGTTHNTTKVIDGLPSTVGLRIGMAVAGTSVGASNYIKTIDSNTQVTTNVNSTATSTESITFTTLATESAGGTRGIKLVCRSIFGYAAACNLASVGGYTNWRVASDMELINLRRMGNNIAGGVQTSALPNATAFPSWPSDDYNWSSTTNPNYTTYAMGVNFNAGNVNSNSKTIVYYCPLLRGN